MPGLRLSSILNSLGAIGQGLDSSGQDASSAESIHEVV